jgi:hypothetical protein
MIVMFPGSWLNCWMTGGSHSTTSSPSPTSPHRHDRRTTTSHTAISTISPATGSTYGRWVSMHMAPAKTARGTSAMSSHSTDHTASRHSTHHSTGRLGFQAVASRSMP